MAFYSGRTEKPLKVSVLDSSTRALPPALKICLQATGCKAVCCQDETPRAPSTFSTQHGVLFILVGSVPVEDGFEHNSIVRDSRAVPRFR